MEKGWKRSAAAARKTHEKREEAVHAINAKQNKTSGRKKNKRKFSSLNAIQEQEGPHKSSASNDFYQRHGNDSSSSSSRFPRQETQVQGYDLGRRGGGKIRGSTGGSHRAERPYFKTKNNMAGRPKNTQLNSR